MKKSEDNIYGFFTCYLNGCIPLYSSQPSTMSHQMMRILLKTNIIISQSQIRLFSAKQHQPDNNLLQQAEAMHSNVQQLHTEVGKGNAQQPTITGTLLQNQAPETYIQQKLIISQSQRQPYIHYSRARKLPFHFTFLIPYSLLLFLILIHSTTCRSAQRTTLYS